MTHESYASNLGTIYLPNLNDLTYPSGSSTLYASLKFIADTAYSAGNTVPTAGIQDAAVTTAKLADASVTSAKLASGITIAVIANAAYIKWRNAANSADVSVMTLNASDQLQIDQVISQLRMVNNTYQTARNNANNAYVDVWKLDTNDDVYFDAEFSKLLMKQNVFMMGRNAADSANINMFKIDASNLISAGTDIVPLTDSSFNLGKSGGEWAAVYTDAIKVGAVTAMSFNASGHYTSAVQPVFFAHLNAAATNVTGNNTAYTVICAGESTDVGSSYNTGTGVYTVPTTGNYTFHANISITGITAAATSVLLQIDVNGAAQTYETSKDLTSSTETDLTIQGTITRDFSAGDLVKIVVRGQGEAGDVWDISATSAGRQPTFFCGAKLS